MSTLGAVRGERGRNEKRRIAIYTYRDIALSTVSLAIFLPVLCPSLPIFLSLIYCSLLALTLVNRNYRCVRFLSPGGESTMKNKGYCARHMHAHFAVSPCPPFIPFIASCVVGHEYPNTRNSTRGSSTARESPAHLSHFPPPLPFPSSIYALAPISRSREVLSLSPLSILFFSTFNFLKCDKERLTTSSCSR